MEEEQMEPVEDQFYMNYSENQVLNCRPKWRVVRLEINAHNCLLDNAQNFEQVILFIGSCNYPNLEKEGNYLKFTRPCLKREPFMQSKKTSHCI